MPDSDAAQRADLLRRWEARQASAATIEQQRSRTDWKASGQGRAFNPTIDGLVAGTRSGLLTGAASAAVIYALHLRTSLFRTMSPGGKVWLVCVGAMAGFFVTSEQAVVGSDARERACASATSSGNGT